jgi:hypothetical protein
MFLFALVRPADLTRLTDRHVDQVLDRANDNGRRRRFLP